MKTTNKNRALFKNPEHQDLFDKNGYVVVDFLSPSEVSSLRAAYDDLEGDLGEAAFASTIMSKNVVFRNEVSNVIEVFFKNAMQNIFIDVTFFWGNFNVKYPNTNIGTVPLHQDPSFLDEQNYQPFGLWVPLIDTDELNGGLQVIPGSQHFLHFPRCGGEPFPFITMQQELLEQFGELLHMKAGQAYIGNPAVFHASPTNKSKEPRIVAAGLAGPIESHLRYHYHNTSDKTAEVFNVDQKYYLSAPLFSKPNPEEHELIESISLEKEIASKEKLFDYLSQFKKESHVTSF